MVELEPPPDLPPQDDPFHYGWRYVLRRLDPDGNEVWDQIPLTLDDVLHPEVGDFIVNSTAHARDCKYLADVIESRCKRHPRWKALVLSDTRVAWPERKGVRGHGPDIAVIKEVLSDRERDILTFDVAAEGVLPSLLIEVASENTRFNDLATKVAHYHRVGVPQYVIVDAEKGPTGERVLHLIDYRHTPKRYVEAPPDGQRRVELLGLGLRLGVRDGRVVLCDTETGEEQGDYDAVARALEAEMAARAEAEKAIEEAIQARREAERAREAEEAARREAARAREAEAEARKAAEAQAADLAARLRALEKRLNPPPGDAPEKEPRPT
jgi:Uma2 family endonuclease